MNWFQPLMLSLVFYACCRSITISWPVYLPRLQASNCDKKRCPAPGYRTEYIKYCGYECPLLHKFICQEDKLTNVIEYCLPVNLTCEPGFYVNGKLDPDDTTQVIAQKLKCPEGTYKQFTNYCIDKCSIQESEDFLPQMFILYEKGNYKEPAKVVCDHRNNYFSKTDKLWYYLDQNFTHLYKHYCEHVPDNPCPSGKRPSKNGSCSCGIVECLSENNTNSGSTLSSKEQPRSTTSKTTPGLSTKHTDHTLVYVVIAVVGAFVICIIVAFVIVWKFCPRKIIESHTTNVEGDLNIGETQINNYTTPTSGTELQRVSTDDRENVALLGRTSDGNDSNSNESEDLTEVISSGSYEDNGSNDDSNH